MNVFEKSQLIIDIPIFYCYYVPVVFLPICLCFGALEILNIFIILWEINLYIKYVRIHCDIG
jgi:hypothetical protein